MPDSILNPQSFLSERDLLMVIHTRVDELTTNVKEMKEDIAHDMKDMKEEMSNRVAALEENKMSKSEVLTRRVDTDRIHTDHELRIRRLEYIGAIAIGAMLLIEFAFKFFWK
jgi:hypothetical protein